MKISMIYPRLSAQLAQHPEVISWSLLGLIIALPTNPTFRSIFLILSVVLIVLNPSQRSALHNMLKTPLAWCSISLFIMACLGCFWGNASGAEKMMVLSKYMKFLYFPILIVGFSFISQRFRSHMLKTYLAVMAVVALLSILKWKGIIIWENPDPGAVFYNHIITGLMIAYAAYLSAWFLWISTKATHIFVKLVYISLLILFTFQIFFIGTGRTGYAIYAILMGTFLLQILPFRKAFIALLASSLILGAIFYQSPVMQQGFSKIRQDLQSYKENDKDTSIGYRIQFHTFSKELFKRHILIGNGTGGFTHAFAQEKPVPSWDRRLLEPHSQYWMILSEFGLLGLLICAIFLYFLITEIIKLKQTRILAVGILVAFTMGNFTDSLFLYSTTCLFFITIMALCLSENTNYRS